MIPKALLGSDDDYWEGFRRVWYPRLHPLLKAFGGYGTGKVYPNQYVGFVSEPEDVIERELEEAGAVRNPVAAYKTHAPSGRPSEGSWVLRRDAAPELVEAGMQLHLTLFKGRGGGREVFAHYEDDWRTSPAAHLREENFDATAGVTKAVEVIEKRTTLTRGRK